MNISGKLARDFVGNIYVTAFTYLATIVSFLLVMADILTEATPSLVLLLFMIVMLLLFTVVNIYSFRVRVDN